MNIAVDKAVLVLFAWQKHLSKAITCEVIFKEMAEVFQMSQSE